MKHCTKKSEPWRPVRGHVKETSWLPRDIKLGCSNKIGELMYGWDETSETLQLWKVINEKESEFVGYVVWS